MGREVTFDYSKHRIYCGRRVILYESCRYGGERCATSKSGVNNDFLGWIDLPVDYDKGRVCTPD